VIVLDSRTPERLRAQKAWLAYLRERQLAENLGWTPDDPEYGGWGFSLELPRKPAKGEPKKMMVESNMPSALFAIAALRSAKVPMTDPVYAKALSFVKRCQNFADDARRRDPQHDDGGFFFIPNDPVQNKGGVAGTDVFGRQRFCSYGSMTADGLRALVRCGLPADHPRVVAARKWLEVNFSVEHNPGRFGEDREVLRDATYYYYCWSMAHSFMALDVREINTSRGKVKWAEALAEEVMHRQRPDGSWRNRFTDAKEDDPLVSTPWAAAALALCRASITGSSETLFPRPQNR
jgi:squalene-hopene/tetraprenyl-beta-curcumene cyclase